MQKTLLFLRISLLHVYCPPVFHLSPFEDQLADKGWTLDSNNTSCISYAIQRRGAVSRTLFDVESLSYTLLTRFELLHSNMYHRGPPDGAVMGATSVSYYL